MRSHLRTRHYSLRTEQAYIDWVRRFILFHGKRHPQDMCAAEVEAFLSHWAVERQVSASTQNQAKASILYLFIQAGFRDRTGVAGRGGAGQAAAAFAGGAHADRGP
ncbi:phage integrase N-terminal SAM-like domain-containing protein [Paracidovorax wautersii]|uniref:phage integrase N-terminal SAM-like domain-containing protein n=1 Tax=Paracidovorax wautersii TaxID=1177982 RepID=UPI001FE7707F|nr:phage integrase N-terminal SAM-like domain-containing protein [Paracidovorax wautersii]